VSDERELMDVKTVLDHSQLKYYLWVEQPENMPTCIALIPYQKHVVQAFAKHYALFK
jgi:hypothetical protein